jgi:DNA-binding NarL/FixJ family response regulator
VVIVAVTPLCLPGDQQLPNKTRQLSPRQAQVLQGLFKGLTTKEIAFQLGLKPRTVKMHIAALKNRFGANTRAQSVGIAAKLGLLQGQEGEAV